ncbi:porin [Roseomonas sp. JC162]|uniref:Porin n=1 Tax=Neoroseomonas marina TaxID=1232220 RepID=A0A848EBZ5_9PROT|nr:porin [Neoroseomonas marina]NMJ40983.1 porin [Neoroseomonas marina]
MRKILLGTTAVAGAALLAPAAFAQAPVTTAPGSLAGNNQVGTQGVTAPSPAIAAASGLAVRIGGYFDFSAAMIYDDWDQARSRVQGGAANGGAANAQRRSRYDFRNDLELYIFVDGRAANGMTYGANFEFQMDNMGGAGAAGSNGSGSGVDLDEAWGYISFPNLGTLQFGQQDNAASQLQVRAPSAGLVGTDGDWYDFIVTAGLFSGAYIASGINDGNDATKVIYLSPQFAGFDFGLSYAQNSYEGERQDQPTSTLAQQRDRTALENEMSAALRYRGTFGPVGLNAGLGGMWANSGALTGTGAPTGVSRQQNVTAYTAGLTVSAYGFAVGGEFTWGAYNGSSVGRAALNPGLDDSYHWVVGATYTMGPLLIGANFAQGVQDNGTCRVGSAGPLCAAGAAGSIRSLPDRTHTIWGVGAVYTLAPGLALYTIYQNVNDENIPTSAPGDARYGGNGTTLATFNGSNTRTINVGMVGIRLAF